MICLIPERGGLLCPRLRPPRAPTAINQQKFTVSLDGERAVIRAGRGPMAKIDLGIVKCNFEIASGRKCV